MFVLLILTRNKYYGERVVVRLHHRSLRNKFLRLINERKHGEAFQLAMDKAQVHNYIPPGKELISPADFTLIEERIRRSRKKS